MELIKYDAMCTAIQACHKVDEVKDIRDKAMALEAYARQAMNTDAERKACEIRLRAERKAGQMLSKKDKPKANQHMSAKSHDASMQTLDDLGISKTQSKRWQKLASINDNDFESALSEKQQTTSGLIKKVNGEKTKMHPKALWLWGRIRDFEREEIENCDCGVLVGEMTETMQADLIRILPRMIEYLNDLTEELK